MEDFIIPLGSAIWSADPRTFQDFPARYFAEFFQRHRFLNLRHKVKWQTVKRGSRQYVERLVRPFKEQARLNCPVAEVTRQQDQVEVKPRQGKPERFDQVIIAVHSDQALAMLTDASEEEKKILDYMSRVPTVN